MSILAPNCQFVSTDITTHSQKQQNKHLISSNGWCFLALKSSEFGSESRNSGKKCQLVRRRVIKAQALFPDLSRPSTVEMESIEDSDHLDLILHQARQRSQPIIIDWMANWCRKCIFLKPKLEKLAAEYDTKIKFYCVDVNNVAQALVKRGNIAKMPTIQLWEDGEMKAEVIGGQKAWIVINEVREMIEQFI